MKSGRVSSPDVRDLKGVVEREKAALGLFISLEEPTRDMRTEAASGGLFHSDLWQRDFPKIQIRTIAQLLAGQDSTCPRANPPPTGPRVRAPQGEQPALEELAG